MPNRERAVYEPPLCAATAVATVTPEPGWYPDPDNSTLARRWDGNAWTSETQPMGSLAAPASPAFVPPGRAPRRAPATIALIVAGTLAVGLAAFFITAWLKNRDADPVAEASTSPSATAPAGPVVSISPSPAVAESPSPSVPVVATSESGLVSLTIDSSWEDVTALITANGTRVETVDGITTELVGAWITSGVRTTNQDSLVVYATYGDDPAADPAADHQNFVALLSEGVTVTTPPTAAAFTTTAGDAGWRSTIVGDDALGPIVIHAATVSRGGMLVTVQYATPGEEPTDPAMLDSLLASLNLVALPEAS